MLAIVNLFIAGNTAKSLIVAGKPTRHETRVQISITGLEPTRPVCGARADEANVYTCIHRYDPCCEINHARNDKIND